MTKAETQRTTQSNAR